MAALLGLEPYFSPIITPTLANGGIPANGSLFFQFNVRQGVLRYGAITFPPGLVATDVGVRIREGRDGRLIAPVGGADSGERTSFFFGGIEGGERVEWPARSGLQGPGYPLTIEVKNFTAAAIDSIFIRVLLCLEDRQ